MTVPVEAPTTVTWWNTLFDSMVALRAAAGEARRAYRAAQHSAGDVVLDRLRLEEGTVMVSGAVSGTTVRRRPHERALRAIADVHHDAETRLERVYEQAAMAYAYGVTWATEQVIEGEQPVRITLPIDDFGDVPYTLPDFGERLDHWAGVGKFTRLREDLERCLQADEIAADLASRDYVTEQEAGEMHDALQAAEGLPDAAFEYALAAEGALTFAYTAAAAQ
ncbi:hypothetical protein [Streptomyces hygroscopicus]|uniref:hypothetical protein n=1 Tax=Streptomyces hygroscopicus TaxID=1912 RepID=UPI000767B685|nr:hypothetical protein [Streptomyces hygroscopicus]